MPALDVIWLRWWFVMIVGGVLVAAAFYLGFYLDARARGSAQPREGEMEEFPADIRIGRGRVPVVLIALYAATAIFIIAYVVFAWVSGTSY